MHRKGKIIIGLIVFIALATLPFLYNLGRENKGPNININTPRIQELEVKQCIESTEYMRANHMKLLVDWRDDVVRKSDRTYVNSRGESYEKSIDTCLDCHHDPNANTEDQFCITCHDYASVKPDCRQCHSWPGINEHPNPENHMTINQ
ncbi:sulfate reduction electron transfer complex DsrMKJOP subunit DsrJ [Desulfitobacterium hafniense]|uniref:Cytochrome c protein n=1 Tax=Desulfitobacterium hafniense TaxID=49338 RepID=A0A098BA79_DESHA|nr:sulfate reduction electron transfer complex DsrMKJOP subunit DsrJ [Desulfitobacterium hafniense]CDX04776.1 Cytochrome c protein [Desulfitobacterium hafniense]